MAQFEARIRRTLIGIPKQTIDKTIFSMHSRMLKIIAAKGELLKY